MPRAELVEPDRGGEGREDAERAVAVGGDLQPGRRSPRRSRARATPRWGSRAPIARTRPGRRRSRRRTPQASLVELAGHPAGHHVGRVRPRAAEGDDDREDPLRRLDGLARQAALERRLEELDHPIVERMVGVGRVAEVGRKHEKAVARVAHDRLGHEAEVADARAVGGDRLLDRRSRAPRSPRRAATCCRSRRCAARSPARRRGRARRGSARSRGTSCRRTTRRSPCGRRARA